MFSLNNAGKSRKFCVSDSDASASTSLDRGHYICRVHPIFVDMKFQEGFQEIFFKFCTNVKLGKVGTILQSQVVKIAVTF